MASGDTKTQEYLNLAATGTRADLPAARGCCNTRTQDLIVDVADRIITEEETRAREDAILQGEIDEIKNNPDVFDIVPTYAALQSYDTSTLTDKDIIRVLADETHDGQSTYYRWSTTTEQFTYVGAAGDYYTKAQSDALLATKADKSTTYTKAEVDTALSGKQNTLTAGTNITIVNDVISATGGGGGGSYTAGNGIDITNDVISVDTSTIQEKLTAGTNVNISAQNEISATDTTYSAGSGLDLTGTTFSVDTTAIQPKLTAGSNVTIDANNEISATDTTYSAGTGLDLTGTTFSADTSVLATQTDLSGKQNALTAGSNITISGDTISATDTTYNDFTGTDGTSAGTAGLVPAPATTDAGKFLKADGTWDTAGGGGPTVVQTTGTSTTDVMSQNAVTGMIWEDPAAQTKIRIGTGSDSNQSNSISIGNQSTNVRVGSESIVIGHSSSAYYDNNVVLGHESGSGNNSDCVAIGHGALCTGLNRPGAIALGAGARAEVQGQMDISSSRGGYTGYGYNNSNYRLLTGLYDPVNAHDAATKGYVDPTTDSSAPTTATVGRLGQIFIDTTNADAYMCVAADTVTPSYTWKKITA